MQTAFFLVGTLLISSTLPMAAYLRAHKREPLIVPSIVSGLLTAILVVLLGKTYGATGASAGFMVVAILVTPFVALIWNRRRAEWHIHPA